MTSYSSAIAKSMALNFVHEINDLLAFSVHNKYMLNSTELFPQLVTVMSGKQTQQLEVYTTCVYF